jgi:hypothetical protein
VQAIDRTKHLSKQRAADLIDKREDDEIRQSVKKSNLIRQQEFKKMKKNQRRTGRLNVLFFSHLYQILFDQKNQWKVWAMHWILLFDWHQHRLLTILMTMMNPKFHFNFFVIFYNRNKRFRYLSKPKKDIQRKEKHSNCQNLIQGIYVYMNQPIRLKRKKKDIDIHSQPLEYTY